MRYERFENPDGTRGVVLSDDECWSLRWVLVPADVDPCDVLVAPHYGGPGRPFVRPPVRGKTLRDGRTWWSQSGGLDI